MKQTPKFITAYLLPAILIFSLFGCSPAPREVICPFTEMSWDSSPEEIADAEGELQDSYYSSYKGTTYVYDKEYMGYSGSIKYMFDDEENLRSMAWLYLPETGEEMDAVYDTLCSQTDKLYGKSGFDSDMTTAKGQVWYLEGGNILVAVMSTGVNEAIQYQFFHPEVSSEKPSSDKSNASSVLKDIFN